jgi:peptidylprolyl isomerase
LSAARRGAALGRSREARRAASDEGTGPAAKKGDRVSVHYVGRPLDGTQFDTSLDRGVRFEFVIGKRRQVIEGRDDGVVGMKKGGKRKLTIPPHLAYGKAGSPPKIGPARRWYSRSSSWRSFRPGLESKGNEARLRAGSDAHGRQVAWPDGLGGPVGANRTRGSTRTDRATLVSCDAIVISSAI